MPIDEEGTIPGELHALRGLMSESEHEIRQRLDAGDRRMRMIEVAMAENTALTRKTAESVVSAMGKLDDAAETLQYIKDGQVFGRVAARIIKWSGAIAGGSAGIWAAIQAWINRGHH